MPSPTRLDLAGVVRHGNPLSDAGSRVVAGAMGLTAALRRGKSVHPHGVVHRATLHVPGGPPAPPAARLLAEPGEHRAIVRFSRSVGLPRPLPDLLGMSIRVLDAYGPDRPQDLLLVTSVDLPVLHHIFVPAGDVQQRIYSSSLPFQAGEDRFLVGVLPDPDSPRPDGSDELDRLARAADTGALRFRLAVASVAGRFQPVAELRIGERLPPELDALRFNPFNCGGGIEPVTFLNTWRARAYPLSQRAWATTRSDGEEEQERAEQALRAAFEGERFTREPALARGGTLKGA